jgi:signal transduction histidine kinase
MKHNIKLNAEIEKDVDTIIADERKIKQILFNLLSNAMKFTPDGGSVAVRARLMRDEGRGMREERASGILTSEASDRLSSVVPRDFIEITVEDTGIGISPEDQKRLFQPFQQLDAAITKKVAGTGLGLNLCKKFIELHGGKIWVESEAGKGSRFIFTIPVRDEGRRKRDEG